MALIGSRQKCYRHSGPHTLMVLFLFFELFAEEQRRRQVPLLQTRIQNHHRATE
jgi:hypothetical protein